MAFLANRSRKRRPARDTPQPESAPPRPEDPPSSEKQTAKRKRVREIAEDEDEGDSAVAEVQAFLERKEAGGLPGGGVAGGVAATGRAVRSRGGGSKPDNEKENQQPSGEQAEEGSNSARASKSESLEVVKQLRENQR